MSNPTPQLSRPRRASMLVLAVLAMAGWLLLGAKTVGAANQLVSSIPAAGSTIDASPATFQMTFKDPVGPQHVVALSCSGQPIQLGSPQLAADTVTLTVAVPSALPSGNCTVAWSVSQPDGTDGGSGKFDFTLKGAAVATTAPAATSTPLGDSTATTVANSDDSSGSSSSSSSGVDGPLGLARLLTNLGLAALFGGLVLIALAWPEGVEYVLTVRFLRTACAVAIAGALLTVICLSAAASGRGIGSSISPSAWTDLRDSTPGLAALARLAFTVGCLWVVMRPDRVIDPTTQLAGLGIPGLAVATIGFNGVGGD
ncbi:MAG TPA: copper resistance protein CopC, partial [Ilumatobacteraceae bacterium]|nr:copper resistance protein CopC [Ilumatobacteraceae bacterium]